MRFISTGKGLKVNGSFHCFSHHLVLGGNMAPVKVWMNGILADFNSAVISQTCTASMSLGRYLS